MSKISKSKFFERIKYNPHKGQLDYHNSEARFRVPVCGRRYGKSTMAARDREPQLFMPGIWGWIAAPTYDLGEKEFRIIWDDLIRGQKLGRVKGVKKGYNKKGGDMYLEFPWRTRLEVRSAQHPESLVGEGLDFVIMSEAAKHREDTWLRYIRPALADKRGGADFPTTPEGQNWLHKLWQRGKNPNEPEYAAWQNPSWDNYMVYPGGRDDPEIKLIERTTPKEWFDQEIAAKFTAFVGRIYSEFTEATHVQTVEYDPALPNYIAWDFGYVNPLAAIEFQVTPRDQIRIWREHYRAYMTLDEHFTEMRNRPQPEGYRIDNSFGDAADPGAVWQINADFCPCIALPEAKENWREGIDLVKNFLKDSEDPVRILDEDGTPEFEPMLVVDHSCANTISEFNNYRAKGSTPTKDPTESGKQGGAQKIDDHAMDAIRYGLMHLYRLGAGYSLADVMGNPQRSEFHYDEQARMWLPETAGVGARSSEPETFFSMNMEF